MVEIHFKTFLPSGGSFVMGGYNRTISTDRGSPIAGRQAWSGNSEGFITTVVSLPFIPPGGRFRWRMASDNSGSGEGWRVDTVSYHFVRTGSGLFTDSSTLARPRHHAQCRPHRQALTLRPRLLRHLAQTRD